MVGDSDSILCLRIEENELILYAMQKQSKSRSGAWAIAVIDLSDDVIVTYHKKRRKQVEAILDINNSNKAQIFGLVKKGETQMPYTSEQLEEALAELEELFPIEKYEDAIRITTHRSKYDIIAYLMDIEGFRSETLQVLIEAGKLSDEQLERIRRVDDYILTHEVHFRLESLKKWLKTNAL